MLYGEFLVGTDQADNDWTYSEYKRIEAIYNADNSMSKEDAYKMYQEPNELIKNLLDSVKEYKADTIEARAAFKKEHEEADRLRKELGEARRQILRLEGQLRRYENAAHDLYYATRTI